ncbi:Hydroxyisourate hydrolase [Mollisia scopiformis]|uniref:hydroxyisourate hydrolase n=1 Tax=Mollisia scopiformis TaxID=149040 RepID=A0A194X7F0_MOLSC|nr:Hydroxyisourate hydrolase [Mollisia scopiformis]KUJ16105.1 Hydroxyisourate hydrolase [Mollisia scopiformis]
MTSNPAIERLQTLSLHLPAFSSQASTMSTQTRDPITCHVLDTTTGRPAANMAVKLLCCTIPDIVFECKTNADGRIGNWSNMQGANGEEGAFVADRGGSREQDQAVSCPAGSSLWKLQFDTGAHYGTENTFFPVVELTFLVKEGEHFHVPLLLGPYSFTTYRGS